MGKAQTNADLSKITCLIRGWCDTNQLHTKTAGCGSSFWSSTTKTTFYKVAWKIYSADQKNIIELNLRLRLYFNIIIHVILFVGLFYCTSLVNSIIRNYNYSQVGLLGLLTIIVITLIRWKDNSLSLKLARIENSFWNLAGKEIDLEYLTKADGSIHTKQSRLITEILLTFFAVYLCSKLLGSYGFIISLLACSLILIMILAEIIKKDSPHWHWHFWIIGNMAGWTFIILQIIAIFVVLLAVEIFIPLEQHQSDSKTSIIQAIKITELRNIKPATAFNLEKDCYNYFQKLTERGLHKSANTSVLEFNRWLHLNGITFFIIILITVFFFIAKPFLSLLRKQKVWISETCTKLNQQGPFVPYISQSWQHKTPMSLRVIVLLHCIIGSIFNITAVLLCIDSISYALIGKTIFFEKIANLWSWVFTSCKITFTEIPGQIISSFLVVIVCLPIICLFTTFIRRLITGLIFFVKIFVMRRTQPDESVLSIQNFIDNTCKKYTLKKPVIILNSENNYIINLRHFIFGRIIFIEISKSVIESLTMQELKTAIAHELGHLRHKLWQIEVYKLLSFLACFPNHYLTLCINWASNEIDADSFAVEATGEKKALKNALIKMASYQISSLITAPDRQTSKKRFINTLNERLRFISISIKFFFGDRLFGYAHPYLSERIKAIDNIL